MEGESATAPNAPQPSGRGNSNCSLREILSWLRTVVIVLDLVSRLCFPHPADTGTASPAVMDITELAVWVLHLINHLFG